MMHNNELWIGYIGEGLEIMNTTTGIRRQLIKNISHPFDTTVMALCPDFNNDVYIGTTLHLIKYSAHNDTMTIIKEIPHGTFISDILQDSRHNLWVALYGKGVYRLNTKTNRWDHFTHPTSLCYDYCISLSTDSDGRIWIGTEGGGVSCYNYQTDSFRSWSIADGLPANTVYKVIDDNRSSLWLSTTKGLCRMTKDGRITTFTRSNGLLNDQFNYKSGILASDGRLYFGSREGFIRFKVQDISSNQLIPTVVITQLRALDRDIPVFNNLPLNLKHNQSTITINYAALSYNAPELNRYAVKMENYDTDWIEMGNNHSVTYSNMPPGDYQFKVKGSNNDGLWNDIPTVLPITIASPWWSSAFMKYCYLLLICYCIYFIYRYIRKRNAFKWQQKLDDLNRAKEKAIYDAKLKFFATVSHEIRTPLSLIKAPFEYICRKNVADEAFFPDNLREDFQENMDIMGLNIDRLISLCNQLLDFSKVENENFILCYTQTNISDTIISILQWFKPVIKQKNITLNTSFPDTPPMSYIDGEALTKIISNLMNNATRYAKSEISLSLHLTDDSFIIKIANDGIPILPANREKVFDIFFREQRKDGQGAGLGLAIVKHLTELLHGKVFLDPDTAQTCFVVDIPLTTVPPSSADTETTPPYSDNFQCPNFINERPVILVVEDNPDMRQFLCKLLNDAYNVLAADDGDSAMEKLNSCEIHLIVSDVKMQRIDGFTLCRQLKTCLKYSHIPIILLTAKTALSDKIEGIEAGADAYIEKPFSSDFLLARIQSILNNRQRLKDAFLSSPYSFIDAIATGEADRKFIETINNIILNNITDSDFSIDNLASEVCMSRSTLDRKIKGLAHITTNDYIKLVRIKQAAKLISEKNYKINEVCYMTGFSSPSYFTKCFKEQFGITPNDLMRKK
jgi:DNA-binding response OmpR family regulator/nitrogen-specific signal transduction histidine kinase